MPELPEVETIVNYLKKTIKNKIIKDIKIYYKYLIKNISEEDFIISIVNSKIIDIQRRGKYILFILDNNKVIRSHLRMEGKFIYTEEIKKNKHTHISFLLNDKKYLNYNDTRKFGTFEIIKYLSDWKMDEKFKILGYEPFEKECTIDWIFEKCMRSKKNIKNFLLDQKTILGLGNIYVDEILFCSNINPISKVKNLSIKDIKTIKENTLKILKDAIKNKGTTIRSYNIDGNIKGSYQNKLKIYGRQGKECIFCKTIIKKEKINGRGTYICENCQQIK